MAFRQSKCNGIALVLRKLVLKKNDYCLLFSLFFFSIQLVGSLALILCHELWDTNSKSDSHADYFKTGVLVVECGALKLFFTLSS